MPRSSPKKTMLVHEIEIVVKIIRLVYDAGGNMVYYYDWIAMYGFTREIGNSEDQISRVCRVDRMNTLRRRQ